jgi:hypothetical protein
MFNVSDSDSITVYPSIETLITSPTEPFGNPSFQPNDCNKSDTNPLNGSAKSSLIEVSSASVPDGNYTSYDEYTKLITPMIMTMWPKNSTNGWEPDTRIFCVTANEIETGSRVPSSAMSIQPAWSSLKAAGLMAVIAVALL